MKLKQIASNMTEVETVDGKLILYSYSTPVAAFEPGEGYSKTSKKWSVTTSRHINKWLAGFEAEEREQEWFDNLI